jgi:plasmid rolling circle replication initiator protein Rep
MDFSIGLFVFSMTNIEFSDESPKHEKRVTRLAAHKRRTLTMLNFLEYCTKHLLSGKQVRRYRFCHNYLLFRYFPDLEKTTLHDAKHCDMHLLCPMCAIRRAARAVMKYEEKTFELLNRNPRLRLYYVVLTVKNVERLDIGFAHLERSMRLLVARRRDALKAKRGAIKNNYALNSVFAGVSAGAYSFEVKRGENSGLWHPHVNLLLLTDKPISQAGISEEWHGVTKDSYVVYCEKKLDTRKAFVEIFKYALKFSDMELADTYHAWETLRGRRLTGSFGDFRGLDIVKDDEEDTPLAFEELFYRFDGRKYARSKKQPL